MPSSPLPWLLLGAWGGAACFAIAGCRACGTAGRVLLLLACAAAWLASVPRLLPGARGVRALGLGRDGWRIHVDGAWRVATLERAVEVLRAGWWLQWRTPQDGRRRWAWVDARRSVQAPYRALCRALRQRADGVAARLPAGGDPGTGGSDGVVGRPAPGDPPLPRRGSRHGHGPPS